EIGVVDAVLRAIPASARNRNVHVVGAGAPEKLVDQRTAEGVNVVDGAGFVGTTQLLRQNGKRSTKGVLHIVVVVESANADVVAAGRENVDRSRILAGIINLIPGADPVRCAQLETGYRHGIHVHQRHTVGALGRFGNDVARVGIPIRVLDKVRLREKGVGPQ